MNETTLEFSVCIKGEEAVLRDIHNKLIGIAPAQGPVLDQFAKWLKEQLVASGDIGNFEVVIHPDHLVTHYRRGGGLNAEAWMETDKLSQPAGGK